jgi:hypothetical protein
LKDWPLLVDLLSVFNQPFKQWLWRVSQELTKFREDELGVRPESRRPAFRWEDDLVICYLGD